jgi:hypothetical protein
MREQQSLTVRSVLNKLSKCISGVFPDVLSYSLGTVTPQPGLSNRQASLITEVRYY